MRIAIVGGDARMPHAAAALERAGHKVSTSAEGGTPLSPLSLADAEGILLPHPLTRDGVHLNAPTSPIAVPLDALFAMLPKGVPLFCGLADGSMQMRAEGHPLLPYAEDDGYLARVAALTAEGALPYLLGRGGTALADTPCLILGAGRLAGALLTLLCGLQTPTAVLARRTLPPLFGNICPRPLDTLPDLISAYPVVINTIPACVLTPAVLARCTRGTLILELSAVAGAVDAEACKRLGLDLMVLPALPGRYAPKSAGEAIATAVLKLLTP